MRKFLMRCTRNAADEISRQYATMIVVAVVGLVSRIIPKLIMQNLCYVREFYSPISREQLQCCISFSKLYFDLPRRVFYEDANPDDAIWINRIRFLVAMVKFGDTWVFVMCSREKSVPMEAKQDTARVSLTLAVPFWKRKALREYIETTLNKSQVDEINIYRWNGKGWPHHNTVKSRRAVEAAIAPNVMTDLIEDVVEWDRHKEIYARLRIPTQRGYMLLGETGTGKSTLIPIIATELHRSRICILSLSGMTDNTLAEALGCLIDDVIVVIEDADSFRALREDHDEGQEQPELTRSGVLNAIGGFTENSGRVLIMTANSNPFTEAAVRPGRIDKILTVGKLPGATIHDYVSRLLPDYTYPDASEFQDRKACDMQAILTQYFNNGPELCKALTTAPKESTDD